MVRVISHQQRQVEELVRRSARIASEEDPIRGSGGLRRWLVESRRPDKVDRAIFVVDHREAEEARIEAETNERLFREAWMASTILADG